jgi:hypothetical protein
MAIHHTHIKQTQEHGFVLSEDADVVRAFHPSTSVEVFGSTSKDAVKQMFGYLNILEVDRDLRYRPSSTRAFAGHLYRAGTDEVTESVGTPIALHALAHGGKLEWAKPAIVVDNIEDTFEMHSPSEGEPGHRKPLPEGVVPGEPVNSVGSYYSEDGTLMNADGTRSVFDDIDEGGVPDGPAPDQPVERSAAGVPLNGAIAYAEGISAADCPYSSETEDEEEYNNFVQWNDEWDAAADEAEAEKAEDEGHGGSVVNSKYRGKYAEMGHPTHCGDWMAVLLNNFCIGDKNTDLVMFERICKLNGVDTSKYKRDGVGWQGRIRMTGRNLLAKKVFLAGKIVVPALDADDTQDSHEIVAPADWMAEQRYSKPKV